jgi:transcriptional regulator with XRE-family HTH domain
MNDAERGGDLDPEITGGLTYGEQQASSHLRSREEYSREMREVIERWLPHWPLPPDVRAPTANSHPASNTSGVGSGTDDTWSEGDRSQDRGQPEAPRERRIPHSFRSVPAIHTQPADGHAIGVGYLLLTMREVAGLSQRRLAKAAHTSQGAIARSESGSHTPSLPSLFRIANAVGYRVVLGLAAPEVATLDPATVQIDDLALVGILVRDPLDGLPSFRVIREPPSWVGVG